MTKEEFFLIKKSEIEMLDTIGARPHNALIPVLKGRLCSEHDAAIAQAAREEVLDTIESDCKQQIIWWNESGTRIMHEGGISANRHILATIESLRSSNPAAPTTKAEPGQEQKDGERK